MSESLESENIRRKATAEINGAVMSDDKDQERKRLEAEHGQVWNTEDLSRDFSVEGFCAPLCLRPPESGRGGWEPVLPAQSPVLLRLRAGLRVALRFWTAWLAK